jgi:antitoxin component HigA of HigAB toxin-antitoxin module
MDLDSEIKGQIRAALDAGDIDQIREILATLESVECPEMLHVELTRTQLKELEFVRQSMNMPDHATVIRSFVPKYKKTLKEQNLAAVLG